MIFLFGIFFPSYQGYASGKKLIIAIEKQIINNDNLVDRLATSKTFEHYYTYVYYASMITNVILSTKNEQQKKEFSEKVKDVQKIENCTYEGFLNKTDLNMTKDFYEKFEKLGQNIRTEFPDLLLLDNQQKEIIISRAAEKGNLTAKAQLATVTTQSCFDEANKAFGTCYSDKAWLRTAAFRYTIGCIVGALACAATIVLTTFGAGAPGAFIILAAIFIFCATAGFRILNNYWDGTQEATCASIHSSALTSCVLQYGSITLGSGAE